MDNNNPVFKKNFEHYLRQLEDSDPSLWGSVLDIRVDEGSKTARIPFFNTPYRVSPQGVVDDQGTRPEYGVCVILLKYLLMCPLQVPSEKDWIAYRDFQDLGQTQGVGLADYATTTLSKRYTGKLDRLRAAANDVGGMPPGSDYPYDLALVIQALPRIPILLLFNDADAQFPATTSILYERRASHFLDAECRIMVDWYLVAHLKQADKARP